MLIKARPRPRPSKGGTELLTLRQLAGLAGVSTSTVSKALNNSPDISSETRDQIVDLAAKHGYQRKFRKKSAAKPGISGPKIGLIYSDVVSRYYSKLIQAYNVKLGAMDGVLLACDAQFSPKRAIELCNYLDQQCHVDGIISIYGSLELFASLPRTRAPLVGSLGINALDALVNGSFPYDYICVNAKTGLSQAVDFLVRNGHRRIAFLGETRSRLRQDIVVDLLEQAGLPLQPGYLRVTEHRFEEAGYETMHALLEEGLRPTAVLCGYDDIAVGASKAIFEAGLRIPEDISLIGYDNTRVRLYNQRMLASVNSFVEDQVRIVMAMLMKRISGPSDRVIQNVSLQTAFLPYETAGPAPADENR